MVRGEAETLSFFPSVIICFPQEVPRPRVLPAASPAWLPACSGGAALVHICHCNGFCPHWGVCGHWWIGKESFIYIASILIYSRSRLVSTETWVSLPAQRWVTSLTCTTVSCEGGPVSPLQRVCVALVWPQKRSAKMQTNRVKNSFVPAAFGLSVI